MNHPIRRRHLPRAVAALTLILLGGTALAATIRCVTPDGRIVYQDHSCPEGSRASPVDDTPNQGFRFAEKRDIERLKAAPADAVPYAPPPRSTKRARAHPKYNADERRFITSGMRVAEVTRRIGKPDRIVKLDVSSASGMPPKKDPRRRWIYLPVDGDPQTTMTLTVLSGRVLHVERSVTY